MLGLGDVACNRESKVLLGELRRTKHRVAHTYVANCGTEELREGALPRHPADCAVGGLTALADPPRFPPEKRRTSGGLTRSNAELRCLTIRAPVRIVRRRTQ